MAITIDKLREMAEEIAPKISSVMGLPIKLDNLEFILEDDGPEYGGLYQFENDQGKISIPLKNGRTRLRTSKIIAHELCHHAQFSNFPHLWKEKESIMKNYQISSKCNSNRKPYFFKQWQAYRLLIEGDASFSAGKAGYIGWKGKIIAKIGDISLAYSFNEENNDLGEIIGVYHKGHTIIRSIYQKGGRKEVNRLYSLSLEDKMAYFAQFKIANMVPDWAITFRNFLLKSIDKYCNIKEGAEELIKKYSMIDIKKELAERYRHHRLRAMPEYKEFIETQETVARLLKQNQKYVK